jgi:HEPN domain-containing protein
MTDSRAAAAVLLARAADDEAAAKALLDVESVTDAVVGFHAQQAVEKAIKAVLVERGVVYRLTHDLAYLMEVCEDAEIAVPGELAEADRLSAFAVRLRYDDPPAAVVDRHQALALASAAIRWATDLIAEGDAPRTEA